MLLLALAVMVGGLAPAYGDVLPPTIPAAFTGTVSVGGVPVPLGLVVEAFVGNETSARANTTVIPYGGQSWYQLVVPGTDADTGKTVTFKVATVQANEKSTWESGKVERLDLTVNSLPQVRLTICTTAGGTVVLPGVGNFTQNLGTVVALSARADAKYEFVNWTGDVGTIDDVNASSTKITMWGNYTITANFRALVHPCDLTISSTAGGTVITPGIGMFTYEEGTAVNLTATPLSGYCFDKWSGDVDTVANVNAPSTVIIMSGNYSITANFKAQSVLPGLPCFIATAAYGSPTAKQLNVLREFRDVVLLRNRLGAAFVSLYYRTSPPIAAFISRHNFVRTAVRVGFVDPIVAILSWSHNLWSCGEEGG
jgi:hypothetical protein